MHVHTHTNFLHVAHTNAHRSLSALIYAEMDSHKTVSDIGGPLQKHISWSDLLLFYRAMVADCFDVELIHQCQYTLSHIQRRQHANTEKSRLHHLPKLLINQIAPSNMCFFLREGWQCRMSKYKRFKDTTSTYTAHFVADDAALRKTSFGFNMEVS